MNCPHCGREDCLEGWQCPNAQERPTSPELSASVGEGSFIAPTVIIRRPRLVTIGKRTNIDHGTYITTGARIGDYCHIAAYVSVIGGADAMLEMGHFSTIGAGSRVVCASDANDGGLTGPTIPDDSHAPVDVRPVRLEPMAIVTTGVTILPGVTLGMGCMVGAGAVVTSDCDAWTVYVGVPAKPVKFRAREKVLEAARKLGYTFNV